jgi:two-component system, OmpR family, sensor histidine kinase MprB
VTVTERNGVVADGEEQDGALSSWLARVSFRTRVTALAAAAVGLAIAMAAVASYVIVSHQLQTAVNSSLSKDATTFEDSATDDTNIYDGNLNAAFERAASRIISVDNDIIQLIFSNGSSQSLNLSALGQPQAALIKPSKTNFDIAAQARTRNPPDQIFQTSTVDGVPYRVLTAPLPAVVGGTNDNLTVAVMIGHSLSATDETLSQLKLALLGVGLASVALAILLGLVVARVTIRPVKRLTAAAEHVAVTQDLDARIEEEGDDELARLGHAFNGMLGALAASRRQQAQLISDAGHELRTPLTSLRTNIEVLMKVRDLPDKDRAELLGDVTGQLDEMTTLVGDVVDMARQDEVQVEPTEVRLDLLVERAVERARRRNSTLTFDVSLAIGSVRAQPALLERAVLNILDNAAKFSPPGGTVEVRLRRDDRWYLDVRDHGPGIAPEDLTRVFDRFYRAPSARSLPGSGLGLAIVRQVVTSHGGSVAAMLPHNGGTLLHVELPIVSEQEPDAPATPGPGSGSSPIPAWSGAPLATVWPADPPPEPPASAAPAAPSPDPAPGIPARASSDR